MLATMTAAARANRKTCGELNSPLCAWAALKTLSAFIADFCRPAFARLILKVPEGFRDVGRLARLRIDERRNRDSGNVDAAILEGVEEGQCQVADACLTDAKRQVVGMGRNAERTAGEK